MRLASDEQNRRGWNDAAQHHAQCTHFNGVAQRRACTVHGNSCYVPRIQCTAAHGLPHDSLHRPRGLLLKDMGSDCEPRAALLLTTRGLGCLLGRPIGCSEAAGAAILVHCGAEKQRQCV